MKARIEITLGLSYLSACIGLCLTLPACANPQAQAAQALKQQLAAKRADQIQSMKAYTRALAAMDKGDTTNAKKHLNQAIAQDNDNAHAWMALGRLEYDQDNLHKAAKAFDHAARLSPLRYEPHYNLGIVLESAGNYTQAIHQYQIALKHAPHQIHIKENLARCYLKTNANTSTRHAKQLISQALTTESRPQWIQWLKQKERQLGLCGDAEAARR